MMPLAPSLATRVRGRAWLPLSAVVIPARRPAGTARLRTRPSGDPLPARHPGTLEGSVICWIRTRVAPNQAALVVLNHVVPLTPLAYSEDRARLLQAAWKVLLAMTTVVLASHNP